MNMKSLLTLAAVAAIAAAPAAFAADKPAAKHEAKVEVKDDNGSYTQTSKDVQKDSAGTTMSAEKKTDVNVDSKGNVETKAVKEEVTDPKGLFNEQKTKTEVKTKVEDGKNVKETKKVVNGKTVVDTKEQVAPAVTK